MAPSRPNQPHKEAAYVADPGTRIGHVHLAADLERSIRSYSGVPGLQIMRLGDSPAFLSAGGYDHHVAPNNLESLGGPPPPQGATGLYHPRSSIPHVRRWPPHCVGWPRDPDDNGVELYCDRPRELWPRASSGELAMCTRRLGLQSLLSEPQTDVSLQAGPRDL